MKIILFFILLIPSLAISQKSTGIINGRILTANGEPAYVTLELKKLRKRATTDMNGIFILQNLPAVEDTLVVTSVEFKPYKLPVKLTGEGETNLGDIHLNYKEGLLQNVEVRGQTIHSYKSDYSFLGTKTQTALSDIPQSISSITKEMIQDKMELTLKDAVNEAAGVNQYSGYDEFTIRGFKAENAKMINGLRGYSTTFTTAMLVNVERIEVVKGPSATLYGNCDPGGTINLVTRKPLTEDESSINISAGSWDHFRGQGDVTGPLNKSKTLLYRFTAGYDNTKSFRDLNYSKSYEFAPSFSYIPNNKIQLNVDFSLSHFNTILDRGQPGFQNDFSLKATPITLTASQPGDFLHETDFAGNLLFSYKINKNITFNSGYLHYITQQNVAEHGVQSYITPDSVNLYYSTWNYHTVTNTLTNYFTFHFSTGKFSHSFLAGYDYISSNVELNQQYFELPGQFGTGSGIVGTFSLRNPKYIAAPVNKYELSDYDSEASDVDASLYQTQGMYIQEQVAYNKWKLLIGLREEMYRSGDDDDTTDQAKENILLPRIGLVYEVTPDISVYGTYNNGFDPFEASVATQVFTAPFKPITSQLFETGAKANFFHNKLSATIALYQLTLHNVAVNANDISNPSLYIQQGEDRSRGIETEANGNILPNLSIGFSYSYCVAKVLESKIASQVGTLVENAPKNTSNSWIKYIFTKGPLKGFGITAGHSQESERNTLDPGIVLPGYIIFSGGVRFEGRHFNAAINLNNITNKTYWIGAYNNVNKWPGAPRNFMMSIGYRFQ